MSRGKWGRREGGRGGLYTRVMPRSTSPSGCDPLFIRERTMHLGEDFDWTRRKREIHRYSRPQEWLNIFLFCNPATRYLVTFSPRGECRWRRSRWLTSGVSPSWARFACCERYWALHKNATISFKCELRFNSAVLRRRNRIAQRVELTSG